MYVPSESTSLWHEKLIEYNDIHDVHVCAVFWHANSGHMAIYKFHIERAHLILHTIYNSDFMTELK
jgi:hypothetical protein